MYDLSTFTDLSRPAAGRPFPPASNPHAGLHGQVALITSGSRGLGAVIAQVLGESGMRVALTDIDLQQAQNRAAVLGDRDIPVMPLALDVGDEDQCAEAVAAVVRRFGRLDVLIDNASLEAGTTPGASFPQGANARLLARLATAQMRKQSGGGHVIHMASVSAPQAAAGTAPDPLIRVSGIDDLRLRDPLHVARAVRHVLQQPEGSDIGEPPSSPTLESLAP